MTDDLKVSQTMMPKGVGVSHLTMLKRAYSALEMENENLKLQRPRNGFDDEAEDRYQKSLKDQVLLADMIKKMEEKLSEELKE